MHCALGSKHAALTAAASQTLQSFLDSNLATGSSVFETCSSVSFAKALAGAVRCVVCMLPLLACRCHHILTWKCACQSVHIIIRQCQVSKSKGTDAPRHLTLPDDDVH